MRIWSKAIVVAIVVEGVVMSIFVGAQILGVEDGPMSWALGIFQIVPFLIVWLVLASGILPGSLHAGFGKWSTLIYVAALVFVFVVQVALMTPLIHMILKRRQERGPGEE